MEKPLISIIVPVYNPPRELFRNCLKSLINQEYKEFEVIIVNDGSTVENTDEITQLIKKDPRFILINQENRGPSAARNRGLNEAKGKYIAFVDADDCIANNWLNTAVEISEKENTDVVYGVVKICNETSMRDNLLQDIDFDLYLEEDIWKIQEGLLLYGDNKRSDHLSLDLGQCGKLYRKSTIKGVRFPEKITVSEDQVFNHNVLRNSKKCAVSNMVAYYYIQNPNSISHTLHANAPESMLGAAKLVKEMLLPREEVYDAFNYRVLAEMFGGIRMAYFFDKIGLEQRYKGIQSILQEKIVKEALKNINQFDYGVRWGMQVTLLKHGYIKIYIFIRTILEWSKSRIKKLRS